MFAILREPKPTFPPRYDLLLYSGPLPTFRGQGSALHLHGHRTKKRNPNKEGWPALAQDPDYQCGLRERYQVEQKFGEAKGWHELGKCRYLGLAHYRLKARLTVLVLNLKRLVKLLYGLGLRQPAYRRSIDQPIEG